MNSTCGRCGRQLTSQESRRRGFGEACWTKMLRAARTARADFTDRQQEQARELITDGGIVYYRRDVFMTVAENGERVHRTTSTACTCWAGLRGRACYHQLAARILTGASARSPIAQPTVFVA